MQYFGQKDLSGSADHENGLLEKLVNGRIGQITSVDSYVEELSDAIGQLLDNSRIPGQIEEAKTHQSEIEHKASIYKDKGVAEKLKKQATYTTDQTKLNSVNGKLGTVIRAISRAYENNRSISEELAEHKSEYNNELIEKGKRILSSFDEQLSIIGRAINGLKENEKQFGVLLEELAKEISALSDEFAEIKREIKDEALDADTYVQLTAEMGKIKDRIKRLEEKAQKKSSIEADFSKAARQRNEILQGVYQAYKEEVERINASQNKLRIEITFKGDKDGFKARLKSDFRGSTIPESKYKTLSEHFSDYVSLIGDWILADGDELRNILTPTEYRKLDEKLREQYGELLKYQVQNKVDIYYHDKLLRKHSIGQRASALILFILTQNNNDIILIDQPEDDLDNKVIYEEVISAISEKKPNIQFIFATHNANIPVLGDAERVHVVDYQDTKIDVSQGNIDLCETHKQIVDIMEGGQDAFERRQLIYEAWR